MISMKKNVASMTNNVINRASLETILSEVEVEVEVSREGKS